MKKVLYLFDALKRGGAETSTLEIASRLNTWIPVVVSIYAGTELKRDFESRGVKVHSLDVTSQLSLISTKNKIQKIIDLEKPDLIHSNLFMADQFARYLGIKNNIPVINSFVNDSYSAERKELLPSKQKLSLAVYQFIDKFFAYRVTAFMSLTKAIIQNNSTALGIDPLKVEVIHRGRDFIKLRNHVDSTIVKEIQQLYGPGPIILTVSRLLVRKGYIESINAFKIVLDSFPNAKYIIAGWGPDQTIIESLIRDLNLEKNVFLLGNRNDVPSLLTASDIFLFPSHYEGQGGALVEAMLMEKKIVATKIPVLEESVKNNYSAKLFEYRNIKDLASNIIWALNHPEQMQTFAKNARIDAEKRFNIAGIATQHEDFYNRVVSEAVYKKKK